MARVPEAYRGYRETLEEGAAPRAVRRPAPGAHRRRPARRVAGRARTSPAFVAAGPRGAARRAGRRRAGGRRRRRRGPGLPARRLRPRAEGTPDAVGRERYAARRAPLERLGPGRRAAAWRRPTPGAGREHRRILAEQRVEAEKVLPGATPMEAMRWLGTNGAAVEGVEAIRARLQAMMDEAIDALDGTHFDLAEPVRQVEAMIAPPGQRGRAVLHPPGAGLLPPRPHLAADAGPDPLPALGPGLDLVPRGRPRPPPAAGAVGLRLAGSCRPTRRRWARSAPTSRAGRCTPSG